MSDAPWRCRKCRQTSAGCGCDGGGAYAPGVPPPDDEPRPATRRTWQPVDLTAVLDGRYEPPQPTVGARDDKVGLFYAGRLHSIASESEGGKTWLALTVAAVELVAGNSVVYLDFEDDEGGVVGRLLALGADRNHVRDRFAYIRPEDGIGALGNREDLAEVLATSRPTLAVLDGITEAMTLHGLELKDNGDVARFGKLLPRWIADQGPAVVALDHVVKDRDGQGRYALGGVHKLNGINGAAYLLRNRSPFGIGITGRSGVYIAKDRPGQLRRHALPSSGGLHWLADLVLTSHDESFVEIGIEPPREHQGDDFRPTHLMTKVAAVLLKSPDPLSQTKIVDLVGGNAQKARQALAYLVLDGFVKEEAGPRGAKLHRLVRPYEQEDESA